MEAYTVTLFSLFLYYFVQLSESYPVHAWNIKETLFLTQLSILVFGVWYTLKF